MSEAKPRELTFSSLTIGVVLAVIMAAANTYLGLYAGQTVSASIPAAVMAVAIYRVLLRRNEMLECNVVQALASSGEAVAAGIIFTVPALVIVNAWTTFNYWQTTMIGIAGGLLGIVFMIPVRRAIIVNDKTLTFPEGVAAASVLRATCSEGGHGAKHIIQGLIFGGLFKFFSAGLNVVKGGVEWAFSSGKSVFFFGADLSPALMGVGFIITIRVAYIMLVGGLIAWCFSVPLMGIPDDLISAPALDIAWKLWSTKVRYMGVGAMIVGGLWSLYSVRKGVVSGVKELRETSMGRVSKERTDKDLGIVPLALFFCMSLAITLKLYNSLLDNWGMSIMTTAIMVAVSFLFVVISSYIVGMVGSSNTPISGMTISAMLGTALFLLVLGYRGDSAILATLGVAAVVCCATAMAQDCSQDLKTGQLLGATPRSLQIAEIVGAIIPAFVVAPVLNVLHSVYGVGTGLKAPQATLFASLATGIFREGSLPYTMIAIGAVIGVIAVIIDETLRRRGSKTRFYVMAMAIGIYLPLSLTVTIFIGGLVRYFIEKSLNKELDGVSDSGTLLCSGLIAGESIMGVVIALLLYFNINLKLELFSNGITELISVALFGFLAWFVYKSTKKSLN